MRLATIPFRQMRRNRVRTLLTIAAIAIVIALFGFLRAIIGIYYTGVEAAATDRLITRNATAIIQPLPIAYRDKIAKLPHVTQVAAASIFFSHIGDPHNVVGAFATEAEPFLALYPEFVVAADEKEAWIRDPSGCIVGQRLSEKFGLHIGDTLTLTGHNYPGEWRFTVRGIYRPQKRNTDTSGMAIHWRYLDDSVPPELRGLPNVFLVGIDDPNRSPDVIRAIDTQFHDTAIQTLTESEKTFQLSFLSMVSAVIRALQAVSFFVLVIMALILGNTIAMSVRERANEIAILKAIGYRGHHLWLMFGGESAFMAVLGGILGVAMVRVVVPLFAGFMEYAFGGALPPMVLSAAAQLGMLALAVGVGIAAAVVPATRVARQSVSDAFQRRA
jgi:putative ABC transport system permease protein